MEDAGQMLHEHHDLIVTLIDAYTARRAFRDLHRIIKYSLPFGRLRTNAPPRSAAVFGIWLKYEATHQ
jgi:hypothetical protein